MKKTFTILGFIFSIIAVALSVLPLYKLAFIPSILALVFGLLTFFKAKKENVSKTNIQLILLLTIIALALAIFKSVTFIPEVGDTQELDKRDKELLNDSQEEVYDIEITD